MQTEHFIKQKGTCAWLLVQILTKLKTKHIYSHVGPININGTCFQLGLHRVAS